VIRKRLMLSIKYKSEIRISKSETNLNPEFLMFKTFSKTEAATTILVKKTYFPSCHIVSDFEFWSFEFVSDFDIRISDFLSRILRISDVSYCV
jgi:hypothetical protein